MSIAHANGDESGRFRLDTPRTSSSRSDEFTVVALAPGYGAGRVNVDPDASARGRYLASTRTAYPRPPARPDGPASPGRRGVRRRDPAHPRSGLETLNWTVIMHVGRTDLLAGPRQRRPRACPSPRRPTQTDGLLCKASVVGLEIRLNVVDPRFAPQIIELATDDTPAQKAVFF